MSDAFDWATHRRLDAAVTIGIRDFDLALAELTHYLDFGAVRAFLISHSRFDAPWGPAMWQEVAVIDPTRLILWHCQDKQCAGCADRPPHPILDTSIRAIPLSALVDQSLQTSYDVGADEQRTLTSAELTLYTAQPRRAYRTTVTETDYQQMQLTFAKDSGDGPGQMAKLIEFAAAAAR